MSCSSKKIFLYECKSCSAAKFELIIMQVLWKEIASMQCIMLDTTTKGLSKYQVNENVTFTSIHTPELNRIELL